HTAMRHQKASRGSQARPCPHRQCYHGASSVAAQPGSYAKGSSPASSYQRYSIKRAEARASSRPLSRAIRLSAMSIPAETPDDVIIVPSSTQRAWRIHCTRGPCWSTQFQASLLEVAGLSSSRPVRASRAEPVHTVAVTPARWLAAASWLKNDALLTAVRVPKPPGIKRMSNAGASAKLYSA